MRVVLGRAGRIYLLALICTLLSQFYTRTTYATYVFSSSCPRGATCAAPVVEAGWPLPWIRTALHPADEALGLVPAGPSPQTALIADLIFYSLLIVLIGQALRVTGRWEQRGGRPSNP